MGAESTESALAPPVPPVPPVPPEALLEVRRRLLADPMAERHRLILKLGAIDVNQPDQRLPLGFALATANPDDFVAQDQEIMVIPKVLRELGGFAFPSS